MSARSPIAPWAAAAALALLAGACRNPSPPEGSAGPPADAGWLDNGATDAGARAEQGGAELPPPAQLDEIEPNDAQHAQGVPERAIVSGHLAPKARGAADDDWYRITPGPGRLLSLRVELAAAGGPLAAALEVYDRDRNRVLRARATAAEPVLVPAVACLEACFVRVSGTVPAAYTLTLLGAPPRDGFELEPNDRAVDANPLAAGAAVQGSFYSAEDEDWYRVTAAAAQPGQFLRVEVPKVPGLRPELELRALGDGALVASFRAAAAGEGLALRDIALPQPEAATPGSGAPDAGDGAGGADAGADSADAGPFTADAGDSAAGAGSSSADAGTSSADAGTSSADASILAADAGSAAADAGASAADAGASAAGASGYYFVLRPGWVPGPKGARRAADPRATYALRTSLESGPPDLEQEPNDDPAHATDLEGGVREGYLSPAGDADWYRLKVSAPSLLRVEVSALQRADVELSVWQAGALPGDKPALLARANEGGVREGELLPAVGVPAGDVLIKVESAQRNLDGKWTRDGDDPDTLYKLTAALTPDDGTHDREPNDDLAHAQVVALPARVTGNIWPKRDVDVYRFRVPDGHGPLDLRVSAVRGVDLMLTLREIRARPDGTERAEIIGTADRIRGEGEESLLAVPLKAGDYTLEVSSPRKDASATQPYTLTIADSQ